MSKSFTNVLQDCALQQIYVYVINAVTVNICTNYEKNVLIPLKINNIILINHRYKYVIHIIYLYITYVPYGLP